MSPHYRITYTHPHSLSLFPEDDYFFCSKQKPYTCATKSHFVPYIEYIHFFGPIISNSSSVLFSYPNTILKVYYQVITVLNNSPLTLCPTLPIPYIFSICNRSLAKK